MPERPGCWVFGRSPESALAKVKTAVDEWFDWLEKHGDHERLHTRYIAKVLQAYNEVGKVY